MPRGFRIRFYPSSISAALWSDPSSRNEDEDFVWAVLRPGDRFIDAGANIGQLALAASKRVGPEGSVIAIEAHPEIYGYLLGNVALNRTTNLQTLNYALGASKGEVAMTSQRSDDQNFVTEEGELRVPIAPLDELIAVRSTRLLRDRRGRLRAPPSCEAPPPSSTRPSWSTASCRPGTAAVSAMSPRRSSIFCWKRASCSFAATAMDG